MSYNLTFDPHALESLESLDKPIRKRILSKLKDLRENPDHFGKPLSGIDLWRLRVGDYRVLSDLYRNEKEIHVVKNGHRLDIYGDLSHSFKIGKSPLCMVGYKANGKNG